MTFTERHLDTGIYEIRNVVDGKRYIGSAVSIAGRWRVHRHALRKGNIRYTNRRLLNSWNKHGEQSFEFRVLIYCSAENLLQYEQAAIDSLRPEYNIRRDAASNFGIKLSPETRRRISEVQRGVPKGPITDEHRKNLSRAKTGVRLSGAARRKISEAQRGKVLSVETRRNMSPLTDFQVSGIRRRIAAGERQSHIARDIGVCEAVISNIKTGKTYPWVEAA